jgi:hypothetical protein
VIVEINDKVFRFERPDEAHTPFSVGLGVFNKSPGRVAFFWAVKGVLAEREYGFYSTVICQPVRLHSVVRAFLQSGWDIRYDVPVPHKAIYIDIVDGAHRLFRRRGAAREHECERRRQGHE